MGNFQFIASKFYRLRTGLTLVREKEGRRRFFLILMYLGEGAS